MKQEVTKRLLVKKQDDTLADYSCSVIATLRIFATKWKPCIICYLTEGPLRYNQLYRIIPNISRKVLSQHLSELERDNVIIRTQYDPKKQHVEYTLSETGQSLLPLLTQIQNWGLNNLTGVLSIEEMLHIQR
ncbi:HxlR family transcriptional regulator [Chitinophaga niastensis]|uniref:HxlR family transcriptional regulator n=1 Tax=Chitinophaga niastensis TaxID=536980 RepID=A0A2P8HP28_CHINA|nr:helix-turn-helix domain-containing protein [Chitinophaga niastensis]PSL47974.1 HxlR family transcriptional regulator [Chitinophaga niastensis]